MPTTPEEFRAFVESLGPAQWNGPCSFYNRDGDQVEVYWENVESYGKWLGDGITLFLERGTDRVVGVEVGNIRAKVEAAGGWPGSADDSLCLELCDHPGCTENVAHVCALCGAGCCDRHAYHATGPDGEPRQLCLDCAAGDEERPGDGG